LQGLVAEVTNRLRKSNKVANVIQVQLKSSDFQVFSKQTTLTEHIQNYEQIWPVVQQLIQELWDQKLLFVYLL